MSAAPIWGSDLAGRRVVVTGAASGIGLAIAEAFAGARVVCADRDPARLKAACAPLGPALSAVADVADPGRGRAPVRCPP